MIEIAICLAIIGFALIAIIGVLPIGMNTQRDNREETLIAQDASMLLETIRSGSHGADDLTNYVYAITNSWTQYNANGAVLNSGMNGYTYNAAYVYGTPNAYYSLTNGAHIIGLLGTPLFTDANLNPTNNLFSGGYSNHITAYVRAMSGLAAEKPPQDNAIMREDTFAFRLLCVNAPVAGDTNLFNLPPAQRAYAGQLAGNLHELRLTFLWPQLANGNYGNGRQTFRATVAGQLTRDTNGFYFYQSQSFTNTP